MMKPSAALVQRMIPTRHPSWEEFASRAGGRLVRNRFWRSDEVVSRMGEWEVHLDTVMLDPKTGGLNPGTLYSTHRGTEVWAGFNSLDGFRFSVRDRTWVRQQSNQLSWDIDLGRLMDAARRKLRPEDTEIGHPAFDERFTSRTIQPDKLRTLLEGLVLDQVSNRPALAEIYIEAGEPEESGTPQLASLVLWERQMIQDADELLDVHEVLLALMERLVRMGAAAPIQT